jgi:hypothetical protein
MRLFKREEYIITDPRGVRYYIKAKDWDNLYNKLTRRFNDFHYGDYKVELLNEHEPCISKEQYDNETFKTKKK